eukprot:12420747-Karenia_brevis.AAC.1
MEAPHHRERARGEPFAVVWVQYMLVDSNMIRKTNDEVELGNHPEPTTTGEWGHYDVGGEKLHCHEVE